MTDTDFARFEKDGWSDPDIAGHYARDFARAAQAAVPDTVRLAKAGPGKAVLDLCCGQGIVTAALAETGAEATGLDFSPAMLALARKAAPGAEFVEGDAMALPFDAGRFDAVTMGFGMLHVPDAGRALAEARRVLKPGGRFVFSTWIGPGEPSAVFWCMSTLAQHGDAGVALPPGPGPFDMAGEDAVRAAFGAAGFEMAGRVRADGVWLADRPDQPIDFFREGTVRGAVLINGQSADTLARLRGIVADLVRAHCGDDAPYRIPVPSVITCGVAV